MPSRTTAEPRQPTGNGPGAGADLQASGSPPAGGPSGSARRLGHLLLVLVWLALIVLIAGQFTSLAGLADTIAGIGWGWAAAALVLHLAYFVGYAGLYVIAFRTVGVPGSLGDLVPVMFAAFFLKAVVPVNGAGALAVFIEDAVERGHSGARAAAGTLIVLINDLASATPIVVAALICLASVGQLADWELIAAALFVSAILLGLAALWLGAARPGVLRAALEGVRRVANMIGRVFRRPALVDAGWPARNTDQYAQAAIAMARDRPAVVRLLALGMALHVVSLIGLALISLAFGHVPDVGLLIAGFGINVIVFTISIIPEGVGAVEGAMTVVFVSLALPRQVAVAITLVFRLLNVWLPVAIGFFTLQRLRIFHGRPETHAHSDR